ncbi:MAG: hypothetical protein CSYNP_04366 [Syntrophus sp. SKADARSKE-3]|nr:hypothetical protein [Syntrophus sp. SKADARSKE-3]
MKIHVLKAINSFTKLRDDIWECGWWKLEENKVKQLIGGDIFFHKKKLEPSFYGGKILGYRIETATPHEGKIIFEFEFLPVCRNIRTDGTGWAVESKIIAE